MCGISGFQLLKDINLDCDSLLKKINNKILHRGPDDQGNWKSEIDRVYLGHRRLSIIDLSSNASQPMISYNERFVLIFNGEIYNFKKLILKNKSLTDLEIKSDTRLLLELISMKGISNALKLIEGMFAFCLWDKKEKTFHLVRDRFGEKPLFYLLNDNEFIFGSEIKVITEFYQTKKLETNEKSFKFFFALGYIPAPLSVYKNIVKVQPAEIVSIKKGKLISKNKYWKTSSLNSNVYDQENIKEEIERSVENMMIADVEVGCFLSGGVDSSIIASIMQNKSKKKIKTFSIGFNETEYDESTYAKKIAHYLKTDHYEMIVSIDDLLKHINLLTKIYDEPFGDSSCLPTLFISKFASDYVKVCLSGDGGDEMFLGYNRYIFAQKYQRLIFNQSIIKTTLLKLLSIIPIGLYDYLSYPISKTFGFQGLSHKIQKIKNVLESKNNIDFYARLNVMDNNLIDFLANEFNEYKDSIKNEEFVRSIQLLDFNYYLPNDILVKVDRASMKNSLEVRSPFLNHKLYEKMSNISSEIKLQNSVSKNILKRILSNYLPSNLYNRPKMGFAIPLNRWMKASKLNKKIDMVINETKWEICNIDRNEIITNWRKFQKYKFCPPALIWNYFIAGLWIEENLK